MQTRSWWDRDRTRGTARVASDGKQWRRRRTWQKVLIIVGAAIVALSILGAVFGDPESIDGPAASGDETADTTTTAEAGLPGTGDAVRVGEYEFVVPSIEQPGTVYQPSGALKDEANGRWLFVQVTVENIRVAEQTFFAGNQKIVWDAKEFGGEPFTWNGTNGEGLNPGVVLDATVLFDLPKGFPEGGVGSILELSDSGFSGGANVRR